MTFWTKLGSMHALRRLKMATFPASAVVNPSTEAMGKRVLGLLEHPIGGPRIPRPAGAVATPEVANLVSQLRGAQHLESLGYPGAASRLLQHEPVSLGQVFQS